MKQLSFALVLAIAGGAAGCNADSKDPMAKKVNRELTVAAAADLQFAFNEVIVSFEKKHPDIQVKVVYGSSGNFFAQLSNNAPFDLFLSADSDYPRKLVEQGHALKDTMFQYAIGQIVVWVRKDSPIDVEKLGSDALLHSSVKNIAIANPKHAPYGKAAEAALKKLALYDKVQERLVLGENIAQTAQFVESGAADIGIIALSLAVAPTLKEKGRYWKVPVNVYPPLEQRGVILTGAKDQEAVAQLRSFLIGPEGRGLLKQFGFHLPEE